MFKLSALRLKDIEGGINLIDLGASDSVPTYWRPISHLTNLIGFDPNQEECSRLNNQESGFCSHQFLPYAIAGESKAYTLYKTRNILCWSLLKPNLSWLRRFTFSDLFEIEGTEEISALTLDDVDELKRLDIDAIKLDTQGLELPILKASENILKNCILVETETGFSENYIGETTFDQIANYMRSMGFELFDMNPNHRISRKSNFSEDASNEQILWCEAIWLRDYCKPGANGGDVITRQKALKALCIYANHGCYAFGLETAQFFKKLGILSLEEYDALASDLSSWLLRPEIKRSPKIKMLRGMLSLIPQQYYQVILDQLMELNHAQNQLLRRSRKNHYNSSQGSENIA